MSSVRHEAVPFRAVVYAIVAFATFSCGDVVTKTFSHGALPYFLVIFFSTLFCVLFIGGSAAARGKARALWPKRVKLELLRSLLYTGQAFMNIYTFAHFPFTMVYVSLFSVPLLVSLLSVLLLRERLRGREYAAIAAGFAGVLIAVYQPSSHAPFGFLDGLVAFAVWPLSIGLNIVFIRYLGRTETAESMSFFPMLSRVVFLLPFVVLHFQPVAWADLVLLALMGSFFGFGMLLLSSALKLAPAGLVYSFQYSQLVWGAVFGYFFWAEVPSLRLMMGAVAIVLAGLYLAQSRRALRSKALEASS